MHVYNTIIQLLTLIKLTLVMEMYVYYTAHHWMKFCNRCSQLLGTSETNAFIQLHTQIQLAMVMDMHVCNTIIQIPPKFNWWWLWRCKSCMSIIQSSNYAPKFNWRWLWRCMSFMYWIQVSNYPPKFNWQWLWSCISIILLNHLNL